MFNNLTDPDQEPSTDVLIVDDSPLELLGMRESLERAKLDVVTFQIKSFEEVFKLSEVVLTKRPKLILMDVNFGLASYDGARLAKTVGRLREPGSKTPMIILHSSMSAAELLAMQLKCDADSYLEKGDLRELPARIRPMLNSVK